jgi:hypothetical protein
MMPTYGTTLILSRHGGRKKHRGDGYVRDADDLVSFAVSPIDREAWSATDFMVWLHSASDRGMYPQFGSRKVTAKNKLPAISSVIWMGSM